MFPFFFPPGFGHPNKSYVLAIPTIIDGGNHTRSFAESATETKAHYACLDVSKALAATGVRVLTDDKFFAEVNDSLFFFLSFLSLFLWQTNTFTHFKNRKMVLLGRKDIQRRPGGTWIAVISIFFYRWIWNLNLNVKKDKVVPSLLFQFVVNDLDQSSCREGQLAMEGFAHRPK